MTKKKVYLCGLIDPNVKESFFWRKAAREALEFSFEVLNPLAGKEWVLKDKVCKKSKGMKAKGIEPRTIVMRDYSMVKEADFVLANMNVWNSGRRLTGSLYELAWAWEWRKIVIVFGASELRDHPFVAESVTEWYKDLEEAVDQLNNFWL